MGIRCQRLSGIVAHTPPAFMWTRIYNSTLEEAGVNFSLPKKNSHGSSAGYISKRELFRTAVNRLKGVSRFVACAVFDPFAEDFPQH